MPQDITPRTRYDSGDVPRCLSPHMQYRWTRQPHEDL